MNFKQFQFLLIATCLIFFSVALHAQDGATISYKAVIDAGSSGSRIYVYKITKTADAGLPEISLVGQHKVTPGVSEFEDNPTKGKENILTLLKEAR